MKKSKEKKEKISRVKTIVCIITFSAIMWILSTYAWFSTQKAVTLSNLSGKVNVAEGLEISLDGSIWRNEIDLSQATLTEVTTSETLGTYQGHSNHVPTELKPASTIGANGNTFVKMWTGTFNGTSLDGITLCDESQSDATMGDFAGYFAFDVFLRNASAQSNPQQLFITADSNVTVVTEEEGGDASTGLQNTVRVAFAAYEKTAWVNATQAEIIAQTVTTNPKISQVTIWEPNANYHVDYMVTNAARYAFENPSRDKLVTTYALNDLVIGRIPDVYDISPDTRSEKVTVQNTVQTTIDVPETGEPESYSNKEKKALKDTSLEPFSLGANTVTRVRIYIWLEGQDVDCVNYASFGGGITLNFGLEKE